MELKTKPIGCPRCHDQVFLVKPIAQVLWRGGIFVRATRLRDNRQVDDAGGEQFSIARLERGNTLAVYHEILNIVGERMATNKKAKLTITGCRSQFETESMWIAGGGGGKLFATAIGSATSGMV